MVPPAAGNLVRNPQFLTGLQAWLPWHAPQATNTTTVLPDAAHGGAVRIANPDAAMPGIQQLIPLRTGSVYRLSAMARALGNNPAAIFGGRVALWLPPQPEVQLVWLTENTAWTARTTIFTNTVTGAACVYLHMGYGNVASTGEFTAVQLEEIAP
jgi:hypothetical protein